MLRARDWMAWKAWGEVRVEKDFRDSIPRKLKVFAE